MTSLSDSPNSDKSCEECPGEGWSMHRGWCVHQEREWWARRLGIPTVTTLIGNQICRRRPL